MQIRLILYHGQVLYEGSTIYHIGQEQIFLSAHKKCFIKTMIPIYAIAGPGVRRAVYQDKTETPSLSAEKGVILDLALISGYYRQR